ncbi:hypothetical protein ASG35_04235 [Burkholderia sp. Leaf177]|uniref:H-NS histone family protein n=1 Tax=Burkholderia sp. Leaf177 TaxID=1736287 RepID=UPI0006FEA443|nr:H-NS histone family protein [Burkholderia sp. Leaf177]KQR81530.1 hypothetical protein ASG35_04235 [Burkholderia sp. Leaf177]
MATYKELRQQADALSRLADDTQRIVRAETLVQMIASIAEFGFTAAELGLPASVLGAKASAGARSTVARSTRTAKYQDPATGTTWTGAGRQPKWIVGEKAGYLISKGLK